MSENEAKAGWLKDLSQFIVEANKNTWAASAAEVKQPQRPGYKELSYRSQDHLWLYRDSYTGYFKAPGTTTIYYKRTPSWVMSYGGPGMVEDHYDLVKPTFEFLRQALMKVTPELPFRGPEEFVEGSRRYTFEMEGDIEECKWEENITEDGELLFTQNGFAGVIINKGPNGLPVFPWDKVPKQEVRLTSEEVTLANARRLAAKLSPVGGKLKDEIKVDDLIIYSHAVHIPQPNKPADWVEVMRKLSGSERRNLNKALRNVSYRTEIDILGNLREMSFNQLQRYNGIGGAMLLSLAFKKPEVD